MTLPIEPGPAFRDNLALLPDIAGLAGIELAGIELVAPDGTVAGRIANAPGTQGSLAVYAYLGSAFGRIDAAAAAHGLALFAEHTADARARPGAHPNIDRLLAIADGGAPLTVRVVPGSV